MTIILSDRLSLDREHLMVSRSYSPADCGMSLMPELHNKDPTYRRAGVADPAEITHPRNSRGITMEFIPTYNDC